jgi:hypothetical protein
MIAGGEIESDSPEVERKEGNPEVLFHFAHD